MLHEAAEAYRVLTHLCQAKLGRRFPEDINELVQKVSRDALEAAAESQRIDLRALLSEDPRPIEIPSKDVEQALISVSEGFPYGWPRRLPKPPHLTTTQGALATEHQLYALALLYDGRPTLADLAGLNSSLARRSSLPREENIHLAPVLRFVAFLASRVTGVAAPTDLVPPPLWWFAFSALVEVRPFEPVMGTLALRLLGITLPSRNWRSPSREWWICGAKLAWRALLWRVRSRIGKTARVIRKVFDVETEIVFEDKELLAKLPPGALFIDPPPSFSRSHRSPRLTVTRSGPTGEEYCLREEGALVGYGAWKSLLHRLRSQYHHGIARSSREMLFIHAGVVIWKRQAILIPGASHAGKSTLVKALLGNGAEYASDEYAVIDSSGMLHPYLVPMGLREVRQAVQRREAPLNGVKADGTWTLGVVAISTYRPEDEVTIKNLPPASGVLCLLQNMILAQSRGAESLEILSKALRRARCLYVTRGEADAAAAALLEN